MKAFILSLCLLSAFGCTSKKQEPELKYTAEEFDAILSTTTAVPDKNSAAAINYSDFSPGVNKLTSRPMIYNRLSFTILEFETETQARNEAQRLNQYYARNYLFDKVEGEPLLEDLMITKFHAQNPKRRIQRKPVNIPKENHGAPAAASGGH